MELKALTSRGAAADLPSEPRCTLRGASDTLLRDKTFVQANDILARGDPKFLRPTSHRLDGSRDAIRISARPGFGIDEAPDFHLVNRAEAAPQGETGTCLRNSSGKTLCLEHR